MRPIVQRPFLLGILLSCFISALTATSSTSDDANLQLLDLSAQNLPLLIEQNDSSFALLSHIFNRNPYYGSWTSKSSLFDFFDHGEGFTMVESVKANQYTPQASYNSASINKLRAMGKIPQVANSETQEDDSLSLSVEDQNTWSLRMRIYDGQYIDQKAFYIVISMNYSSSLSYDAQNATVNAVDNSVEMYLKESGTEVVLHQNCLTDFSIYLIDSSTLKPALDPANNDNDLFVQYRFSSSECNFEVNSGILYKSNFVTQNQIYIYAMLLSIIGLFKLLSFKKLRDSFKRRANAYGISLGSLWFISTLDYYLLILNIVLVFTYSIIMIFPCIVYIALTFVLERKTILKCLFSRNTRSNNTLTDQEYRSCGFYFVALALLFVFELIFILTFRIWIMHVSAFVFLPQIVHNFKRDRTYISNTLCIIPVGLINLAFAFYVKFYPENIFRLVPDTFFITTYSGIMFVQVMLLLIQLKYPRFCFPSKKRKQGRLLYEDDVCSICIGHLTYVSGDSPTKGKQKLATIETICDHVFHESCLRKWVKTKAECPICRANIEENACDIGSELSSPVNV